MATGDPIIKCPICNKLCYLYGWHDCQTGKYAWEDLEESNMKNELNKLYEEIIDPQQTSRIEKRASALKNIKDEENSHLKHIPLPVKKETYPKDDLGEVFRLGKKRTLIVNIFSGPGSGKSTMAAGIFHDLKEMDINCELSSEFAKDLTWEKRHKTIEDQIYIFGKQYHKIHRLLGEVDVIVTDSPLLLTIIYDSEKREFLKQLVMDEHKKMWTYNVFLNRTKKYNPKGRNQTETQSKQLDTDILDLLDECGECYETFNGNSEGKDDIVKKILILLENNKKL